MKFLKIRCNRLRRSRILWIFRKHLARDGRLQADVRGCRVTKRKDMNKTLIQRSLSLPVAASSRLYDVVKAGHLAIDDREIKIDACFDEARRHDAANLSSREARPDFSQHTATVSWIEVRREVIPSFLGQKSVKVYYNMVKSLPQDIASVVALGKLKDEFDMAGTHFILLPEDAPASDVSAMTEEIKAVDGVTLCLSLHSVVGGAIPLSMLPDNVRSICLKGGWQLMMVNSEYETASDALNAQIEQITAIVKSYCPGAVLTGEGILTKDLIEVTNRDFTVTNIISIGAIFLLILICFKSVSMPVLLVLAIELAIMINESISFLTGTEIPFIAPTVIGCVQLGATVDYAMLMGTRFKEELQRGRDKYEAIRIAADESDRSIFQSASVFFLATFGVYVSCNISIIRSICALLARGSLISAAVIILCLPSVLVLCEGGDDPVTVGRVTEAVTKALDISTAKVCIAKLTE